MFHGHNNYTLALDNLDEDAQFHFVWLFVRAYFSLARGVCFHQIHHART